MMTTLLISHTSALSIHHSHRTQNSRTHSFTPGLKHTSFTNHPTTDCWWPTTHRAILLWDIVAQAYRATKFHHFSSSRPSFTSRVRKLWTVKWFLHWAYAVDLQQSLRKLNYLQEYDHQGHWKPCLSRSLLQL